MEPCAPGTEDDPPIMYSTLTKQENEQERLLALKAILRSGRYENVFELSYVNGAEHWFCRACECPVMGRVFQHEIGKRHSQNLANFNKYLDPERQNKVDEIPAHDDPNAISIAPGEPVPPGFESEVSRVAQIQERLDGFKVGPLVALEYLVELQDYDAMKEPLYLCILCDKRGDPRTVLTHLASYNHVTQYLQKHFPTCYRALAPYMTKQYKRNWQVTLQKIAEGIEKKFGRLKPFPIDKDKFENDRMQYLTMIAKGRHFSELSGYTFEELVVHEELTKSHEDEKGYENTATANWGGATYIEKPFKKRSPSPPVVAMPSKKTKKSQQGMFNQSSKHSKGHHRRRRTSLSSVSSVSSNDDDANRKIDRFGRNKSPPARGRHPSYSRRRSPSSGNSLSPRRRRSPSPRKRGVNERDRKRNSNERRIVEKEEERLRKIEEFRKLSRAIENDMQNTLKHHEKNPEKHPHYNEEWKAFWNKRYKELQSQGVDVAKYDFKPEWIQYWNKKMTELHTEDLRNKKDALRRRLGLPEEVNPIKFRIATANQDKASPKQNRPMAAEPDQDNEVIVIDDNKEVKSKNRSHSPWEDEPPPRQMDKRIRRSPMRGRDRSPQRRARPIDRSLSRDRLKTKSRLSRSDSREKERDFSRNMSRSPIRDEHSRGFSPFRGDRQLLRERDLLEREKRSDSREGNWEKRSDLERRRMEYRESSYERDLRGRERIRTVADLPWEREKSYRTMYEDYYRPPPMMRDATRKPVSMPQPNMVAMEEEEEDEGEINVVDVLRILTAIEERLGSLGPKVIDLLAQALAMEKKEANSSENLLDNDVNCVMFETIKEKLKGQLLAGLVDMMQERAVKKAIKKIASLIHLASQRKRQREKLMPKVKGLAVPGVGSVDRQAIARHIANALILQGKTDVSQNELEQLINAVVGMAEASKNANKPMTTAGFLQQLSGGILGGNNLMTESGEKIIIPTSAKKDIVEINKLTEPLTPSPGKSTQNMENLSDSDLQTLLQNFKDLCTEEQHNLITYLKKLEDQEPERVEKLRQFVDLDVPSRANEDDVHGHTENKRSRDSPFSDRIGGANPSLNEDKGESDEEEMEKEMAAKEREKPPVKIHVDSEEEEDYTFEDVVKTASKNVKDKELASNMKIVEESMKFESAKKSEIDLTSAKDLISNLMSNITKGNTNTKNIDLLGLGGTSDFAKTLSGINMANLANIVSSVKHITEGEDKEKKKMFEDAQDLHHSNSRGEYDRFDRPPSRPEMERSSVGSSGKLEDRSFPGSSKFESRSFPSSGQFDDRSFPSSGKLEDRSFGAGPGRLDISLNIPGRLTGGPGRLEDRSYGGPGRLEDRQLPGGLGRLDDRPLAGGPGRLDDRPLAGGPGRLEDRSLTGGSGRLDDRSMFGGPSNLDIRSPYGTRSGMLDSGFGSGRLEDRQFQSKLNESSFSGLSNRSLQGLSEPGKSFPGSGFGRGLLGPNPTARGSMPMLPRGSLLGMAPRNITPFGSMSSQQFSNVRGPRPTMPDPRPRFNTFSNDFNRPGGNFNRW